MTFALFCTYITKGTNSYISSFFIVAVEGYIHLLSLIKIRTNSGNTKYSDCKLQTSSDEYVRFVCSMVYLMTFLGSSKELFGMLMDFFKGVTQVRNIVCHFLLVIWLSPKHDINWQSFLMAKQKMKRSELRGWMHVH